MTNADWEKIRNEFAVTRELAYFQSAGMSPIPRKVYKTLKQSYKKVYRYGDMFWHKDLETVEVLRRQLASLTGCERDDVIFMHNTSLAFSQVALSLKKSFGDDFNLVSMQDEFPASNVPFEYQGIHMKFVKPVDRRYPLEHILEQVDDKTRGIVCSYVQYGTGYRHDLEAIGRVARQKGLLFIVNATQGFPVFPVDMQRMNIDVMSASLHKWGCAGHVGAMFCTTEAFRKRFPAPMAGWLSVQPPPDDFIPTQKGEDFNIHPDAMQYNFGTINLQSLLGLKAAFDFMAGTGWENIRKRIMELTTRTIAELSQIPEVEILTPHTMPTEQSGIISINIRGKSNQGAVVFLDQRKVVTTIRQKSIRIACNFFNNDEDIMRLAGGLKAFCHQ